MLIGEHTHGVDNKNRIIVPSRFREDLGDSFVISKGLDGCLYIYPKDEWKVFETKLKNLPLTNKNSRTFARFFFSGANEVVPDKMGRILIPQPLMEYAEIKDEVVSIGMDSRVEVWSSKKWKEYCEREIDMDEVASGMEDLGI